MMVPETGSGRDIHATGGIGPSVSNLGRIAANFEIVVGLQA